MIELYIVAVLWVCGVHWAAQEGNMLHGLYRLLDGIFLLKPIINCPWCMPSLHIWIVALVWKGPVFVFEQVPLLIFGIPIVSCMVVLLWSLMVWLYKLSSYD